MRISSLLECSNPSTHPAFFPYAMEGCWIMKGSQTRFRLMNKKSPNMAVPDFLIAHRSSSVKKHLYEKHSLWLDQGVDSRSGSAYKTRVNTHAAHFCSVFRMHDPEENPWWDISDSKMQPNFIQPVKPVLFVRFERGLNFERLWPNLWETQQKLFMVKCEPFENQQQFRPPAKKKLHQTTSDVLPLFDEVARE